MLRTTVKNYIRLIFFAAISLLLTACGFHWRGADPLPTTLQTIYLKPNNPYDDFTAILKKELQLNGVQLAADNSQAPITLQILQNNLSYLQTSVGASSQATVYNVVYHVTIAIRNSKNKMIVGPENIDAKAFLTLNANQLLTSNNQIETLSQQLQQDAVRRIFDILNSPQVREAANSPNHTKSNVHIKHYRRHHYENHTTTISHPVN